LNKYHKKCEQFFIVCLHQLREGCGGRHPAPARVTVPRLGRARDPKTAWPGLCKRGIPY